MTSNFPETGRFSRSTEERRLQVKEALGRLHKIFVGQDNEAQAKATKKVLSHLKYIALIQGSNDITTTYGLIYMTLGGMVSKTMIRLGFRSLEEDGLISGFADDGSFIKFTVNDG